MGKTNINDRELRVRGISPVVRNDLMNIAKNTGAENLSAFLKPKLRQIRDEYPPDMWIPKED